MATKCDSIELLMNMNNNITWITFNAFLDTDLYIVKELTRYYSIDWHIIRSENDQFEYIDMLEEMKNIDGLKINLHICGRRLRKIECVPFYNRLISNIKKSKSELVFTSMAGAPYFIPILAMRMKKNNVIVAIHNVHVPKGGGSYWFFKLYNTITINSFMNFQTFSKSQYMDLKAIVPKKNVFYTPFILKDYGRAKNKRLVKEITFLNFGNIREYKRIDVLIKAAQRVYEITEKSFRVIIAGKCEDWEKYKKLIKYDALFDIRLGRVENEDVPDLFNEADYFVAPYQDIAQSGSAVVAINYGKPIIASKLPAFEEYIIDKKTGYLIKPADVESLVDVMKEIILSNNDYYIEMVKQLKHYRDKQFSTNFIVERYRENINNVISK